jgi:signal transduction histidine kinase
MQERAAMLGGTFTVASAPGEGTTVTVTLAASSPDRDR